MNWKTIYAAVTLFSCAVLFFSVILIHKEKLFADTAMTNSVNPDTAEKETVFSRATHPDNSPLQLTRLTGKNLFDPLRGKRKANAGDPKVVNPHANTSFKLHGIFNHDDGKGALIIGASIKGTHLFKEKDPLGDGYFVREIKQDEVIITGGLSEITLKLEKSRAMSV